MTLLSAGNRVRAVESMTTAKREDRCRKPDAEFDLANDRADAEEDLPRLFTSPAQKPEDESDQQRCVEQQERGHVAERQASVHEGRQTCQRQHVGQREL